MINSCVHFTKCSGCDFLDHNYKESLILKQEYLEDLFKTKINKISPSEKQIYYRNKLQLPFGVKKGKYETLLSLGLHSRDYSHIIDLKECKIQEESLTEISFIIRDWARINRMNSYNPKTEDGLLKYVLIKKSNYTNEVLICIITSYNFDFKKNIIEDLVEKINSFLSENFPDSKLAGIIQNINFENTSMALGDKYKTLYGKNFFKEKIMDNIFHVKIQTFIQVNPFVSNALYKFVKQKTPKDKIILDLYSGIGTLTLFLSDISKKIIGIEINKESVLSAKNAIKANNKKNVQFIEADATRIMNNFKEKIEVLIFDPPRIGLTKKLIESSIMLNPEKIIYISCDPITLEEDLIEFKKYYSIEEIQPFDMFPFTKHIETVVILKRKIK